MQKEGRRRFILLVFNTATFLAFRSSIRYDMYRIVEKRMSSVLLLQLSCSLLVVVRSREGEISIDHKERGWRSYFAYAGTYSTTPVVGFNRVFLICLSCFFDMAFIVAPTLCRLRVLADFWAFLNSFSCRLRSFSNRRSFFRIFACRRSSRSSSWSSFASFFASRSACRRSQDLAWLFFFVKTNVRVGLWVLAFHERPDTFLPLPSLRESSTISPLSAWAGSAKISVLRLPLVEFGAAVEVDILMFFLFLRCCCRFRSRRWSSVSNQRLEDNKIPSVFQFFTTWWLISKIVLYGMVRYPST